MVTGGREGGRMIRFDEVAHLSYIGVPFAVPEHPGEGRSEGRSGESRDQRTFFRCDTNRDPQSDLVNSERRLGGYFKGKGERRGGKPGGQTWRERRLVG